MTSIAFVGLGVMGDPMAANLARAGHDVRGVNRSPGKGARLREAGGRITATVAEAVDGAEAVVLMLPDSPDVEAVLMGDGGVFDQVGPDVLVVDFSSIRPDTTRILAEAARARGIRLLDAPVSGGEQAAIDGALSVMVGGDAEDVEAARPILDVVGATVVHVGPAGAGQTVKAANQLIVAGTIELVAEALVFLEAHEVDLPSAVQVLRGGLAGSAVLDRKSEGMLSGAFAPGFRVDLHHKDLGIVTQAARDIGVAVPLGAHVADLMASLRAQGHGGLDHSALLKQVRTLSGREG